MPEQIDQKPKSEGSILSKMKQWLTSLRNRESSGDTKEREVSGREIVNLMESVVSTMVKNGKDKFNLNQEDFNIEIFIKENAPNGFFDALRVRNLYISILQLDPSADENEGIENNPIYVRTLLEYVYHNGYERFNDVKIKTQKVIVNEDKQMFVRSSERLDTVLSRSGKFQDSMFDGGGSYQDQVITDDEFSTILRTSTDSIKDTLTEMSGKKKN